MANTVIQFKSWVTIIKQTVCKGPDQLDQFMDKIVSLGGEGVVIKDPSKPYHTGKSPYVLKLKQPSFMEAEVTGYMAGKGKYKGMMGSLILSTPSGIIFKLGTGFTDDDRKNPPPVGSTVIFRHHGYTSSGIPRFASFIRVKTGE